jgi:hypothetical protein
MRRQLVWSLAMKLAALILLWCLFFSAAQHEDPDSVSRHFGLASSSAAR